MEEMGMLIEVRDANAPEDPDVTRMREDVDEDGLIPGLVVETRYCEIKNVIPADGFLRIVGDDDFTDVEIRVLHKTLEALGWIAPTENPTTEKGYISDGFGNQWSVICPHCKQATMEVVRPGKAQCGNCG